MTEPKFKVGDIVTVLRDGECKLNEITHFAEPGDIGVVERVHPHRSESIFPQSYSVKFREPSSVYRQSISETCIEFADGPKETKSSSEADCIRKLRAFMDGV